MAKKNPRNKAQKLQKKREKERIKRSNHKHLTLSKQNLARPKNTNFESNCVYRFFKEEWQAEALTKGEVWISTLETCRNCENPKQGDAEEATMNYNSGSISGNSENPDIQIISERLGMRLENVKKVEFDNNTSRTKIPDAFVLCTTDKFSPDLLSDDFGKFCVKINKPDLFFKKITLALGARRPIRESALGKVIYKDRFYKGTEVPPGPIGFVKPRDQYADQSEVRMLWIPQDSNNLEPFSLECHELSELCERI
jgi:hypothetical protein